MFLQIDVTKNGSVQVVALSGTLESSNVSKLKQQLESLLKETPSGLVLDLESLDFLDSSGIGIILYGAKLSLNQRVPFFLSGPNEVVRQTIALTQIDRFLQVTPSLDVALDRIAS